MKVNFFIIFILIHSIISSQQIANDLDKLQNWVVAIGTVDTLISVKNGIRNTRPHFKHVGTGIMFYIKKDSVLIPTVVTAKHVLNDSSRNWIPKQLYFRFHVTEPKDIFNDFGIAVPIHNEIEPLYFYDTTENSDIAVVVLPDKAKAQFSKITQLSSQNKTALSKDYKIGNDVYVYGFPNGVGSNFFSTPLLRQGIISWANDENAQFLIDCDIFPGNSGGPVFLYEKREYVEGSTLVFKREARFIGIISQRRFSTNKLFSSNGANLKDSRGQDILSLESLGIGVVEPATKIISLLRKVENNIN